MPTTVHIPEDLLRSVDREARKRKISRNRYIIEALQKQLTELLPRGAAPRFRAHVRQKSKDPEYLESVNQLFSSLGGNRKSSKPIINLEIRTRH